MRGDPRLERIIDAHRAARRARLHEEIGRTVGYFIGVALAFIVAVVLWGIAARAIEWALQ